MSAVYFTESNSDLPKKYVEERDLQIIHMPYRLEEHDYEDDFGQSISPHDFYEKERQGIVATTFQLSPERYKEIFTPYLQAGHDIVYLAFSSALSGTYQSAMVAKPELEEAFPDRKIYIIDSLCASLGEGLLMHHMLNKRDAGVPDEEVVAWAEANKGRMCHWFTVYDLNFLRRGGRVSAAAAFLGTMLSIKPILHVDDEGRLVPVEKVKGRARSVQALVDHMKQTVNIEENSTVFISHGDSEADAQRLKSLVEEAFGIHDIRINNIGPVIGTHSGPDTLAVFFLGSHR